MCIIDRSKASALERKFFAKVLLIMWCDAITRNEGDAFEAEWLLGDAVLETPTKKRRQDRVADDDDADPFVEDAYDASTAVADEGEEDAACMGTDL